MSIAYKIWDKDLKKMILFIPSIRSQKINTWLLSTLMKDIKGNEIFVGDLLQWNDEKNCFYEVFYNNELASYRLRAHFQGNCVGGMIPELHYDKKFLIIGNIFENPELATGKRWNE